MIDIDKERRDFEAALRKSPELANYDEEYATLALQRNPSGDYPTTWVQSAWMGWQMGRAAALDEMAEFCDGLAVLYKLPQAFDVGYTMAGKRAADHARSLKSTAPP